MNLGADLTFVSTLWQSSMLGWLSWKVDVNLGRRIDEPCKGKSKGYLTNGVQNRALTLEFFFFLGVGLFVLVTAQSGFLKKEDESPL